MNIGAQRTNLKAIVSELKQSNPDIVDVSIIDSFGLTIATTIESLDIDNKVSGLSSMLLTSTNRIVNELKRGAFYGMVIMAKEGNIIIEPISATQSMVVLTVPRIVSANLHTGVYEAIQKVRA
jgi:predicted regulator of Ras-like GTPase activity (Roadblock/LC7/MglB family)